MKNHCFTKKELQELINSLEFAKKHYDEGFRVDKDEFAEIVKNIEI